MKTWFVSATPPAKESTAKRWLLCKVYPDDDRFMVGIHGDQYGTTKATKKARATLALDLEGLRKLLASVEEGIEMLERRLPAGREDGVDT